MDRANHGRKRPTDRPVPPGNAGDPKAGAENDSRVKETLDGTIVYDALPREASPARRDSSVDTNCEHCCPYSTQSHDFGLFLELRSSTYFGTRAMVVREAY